MKWNTMKWNMMKWSRKKEQRNRQKKERENIQAGGWKGKLFCGVCLCSLLLAGCAGNGESTKVVLTTGFTKDEIFRIESMSCTKSEIMVYLTNTQNQYENVYGEEIWQTSLDGVTLEESIKETVLAQIAQVKTMNLLAKQSNVQLTEEEQAKAKEAAAAYYGTLNDTEIESMSVDQSVIEKLYLEYELADKVYQYIIKDINPEISDDEARTITVEHILIKTYSLDGTGKKIEYDENEKTDAFQTASELRKRAIAGEDFDTLIMEYSEDPKATYSFGKGEMEQSFEDAAFNLETGEISEVIGTSYGYHVIKCINTFNREETDANKVKIVEERKREVFGEEYDAFVASLTRDLNHSLWESISFIHNSEVTTSDFFSIYGEYFPQES